MGEAASVGPGDEDDPPPDGPEVLGQDDRGDETGRFIGVRPAEDEDVPSGFGAVVYVNVGVAGRAAERGKIVAQLFLGGQALAGKNRLSGPLGDEIPAGEEGDRRDHSENQDRAGSLASRAGEK
jgi:hypothetical protein